MMGGNGTAKLVREWVKGEFPKGFEVLDIGAGTSPALGATRAVDINRGLFTKNGKGLKKKVVIPKSLVEYINYDARCLPYEDEYFDRGISRWGIGARIHGLKPISELYRVLKKGGVVYIAILEEDKKYLLVTKRMLRQVGFNIIDVFDGEYIEGNGNGKEVKAKEFVIHAIKA